MRQRGVLIYKDVPHKQVEFDQAVIIARNTQL